MPPPNATMATAIVIDALPYSDTQNLTGMTPIGVDLNHYPLWYQLPASLVSGGRLLGARGEAVDVGGAVPITQTYVYVNPPVGSVGTPYLDAVSNTFGDGRVQVPLASTPQPYFFRVLVEDWAPPTYDVTFTAYVAPANQAIPAGSILITSDEPGFPAAALAVGTGEIFAFITGLVAGETGDILPDGRMLLASGSGPGLYLYDAALAQLAVVPLEGNVGSGNQVDTFYAVTTESGQTYLRAISAAGVLGTRWGPIPGVTHLVAVARDETRAYLTGASGPVRQWDLGTDAALADLAPTVPGYDLAFAGLSPGALLVLADGSVLVGYFQSTGADSYVRHYSSAGAVLHTYPEPTDYMLDRIAHDPTDDSATFWAWWKGGGVQYGLGRFDRIRVSDGVVLSTTISAEVTEGAQLRVDSGLHDDVFGHPYSCPFLITRTALDAPPDGGPPGGGGGDGDEDTPPHVAPSYHLDARYIRRLRRAPHVAQEHSRVFYRRFELDLERGQGLATGQGSDPMVLLRISRDGGQTWGEESRMSAGKLGEYTARVMARRLGHGRDLVFEVVVSDPIAWSLVGAWLDLEPGTN